MVKRTLSLLLALFAIYPMATTKAWALPNIDKIADAGKFEELIAVCDKSIRENPKDTKAFGIRAWAKYRLDRFKQSIEDCNQAIKLDKNYARAYRYRASAKYELHQYQDAIKDCEKAISLDRDGDKFAYWQKGQALYFSKKYQESIDACNEAIRLAPKMHEAFTTRSWALICLKKYELALRDLNSADEITHDDHTSLLDRAWLNLELRRYKEALKNCDRFIAKNPTNASGYCQRAWVFYNLNQYSDAIKDASKSLSLNPNESDAYACRGKSYWRAEDKRAVLDFKKAAELVKTALRYETLAFCCTDFNLQSEREDALTKAIALRLRSSEQLMNKETLGNDYYCRGISRFEQAKYQKAIDDFTDALAAGSFPQEWCYLHRARAELRRGNLVQALRDSDASVSLCPFNMQTSELKAEIFERQGHPVLAYIERMRGLTADLFQTLTYNPKSLLRCFQPPVHTLTVSRRVN